VHGKRILVTGAGGFIGSALAARLLESGAEVHATTRGPIPEGQEALVWHQLDLSDAEAVERAVGALRPQLVYHLASRVVGRRDLELVLPTFRDNLASAVSVLAAATAHRVERVVLAGSMEESLPSGHDAPGSPYAVAKAAASLYARFFHALYGTPVVVARIFMVYGPGQRDRSKVIPASILAALARERPRIASGRRPVDWIYVDDVVAGLMALGTTPSIEGKTLDLGSGELVSVGAVVEKICVACGVDGPELGALPDRPLETVACAEPRETLAAIGWRPEIDLDEGLARTIAWLRAERAPSV